MRGKLIVIEGTDCSGKETQSNLLLEKLLADNIAVEKKSFPMYDTPTGKIVGGPYLGKEYICDGWFDEGAVNVEPKVAALYYAADRRYNLPKINELLDQGINIILDRYVYSNMAHQGGKIYDMNERMNMYAWLDVLEFKLLELPKPDIAIFLHMPMESGTSNEFVFPQYLYDQWENPWELMNSGGDNANYYCRKTGETRMFYDSDFDLGSPSGFHQR